ncbi:hypothetical protein B0T20DRAFT_456101 [Sordaria brevicollis]|uniref:Uncharacterized protein n=1 Tax=Sordaria brevicollis TaxID=83679 RepID=A0AAE0P3B9_SORBR|nr:hypothetical protein B0T20DRAFT_456101 [Sordaria brevicollis]
MDTHSPFGFSSTTNSSHNNSTSNLHQNPSTQSSATMVGGAGGGGWQGQGHHTHSNFTPEMRDKQARGKDPYAERSDEESDFEGGESSVMGGGGGFMGGRSGAAGAGAGGRGAGGLGTGMGRAAGGGGGGGRGGLAWGERRDVRRRVEISGNAKLHGSMSNHVDYATLEKRQKASMFLNDPELLITHAEATGMTIAGSRHHFMLMLCGYDNQPRKKTGTHGTSSVSSGSSSRYHQTGSGYSSSRV